MTEVTKLQLWEFLSNGGAEYDTYESYVAGSVDPDEITLDQATFTALKGCDLKHIIAASEMSENHLGGDDLVSVADGVLEAQVQGYRIATWYGHNAEALVAGYRPQQLKVKEGTPTIACLCGYRGAKMGERIAAAMLATTGLPACPQCGQQTHLLYEGNSPTLETVILYPADKKVVVDATGFSFADDQVKATTYYGGTVSISAPFQQGQTIHCSGTDRDSVNCYDDVTEAVLTALGISCDEEERAPDGKYEDLAEQIMQNMDNQARFEVLVKDGEIKVLRIE